MGALDGCFPAPAEIGRLAEIAATGRQAPFVGTGHPDTMLACPHGQVRLGDVLAALAAGEGEGEEEAGAEDPAAGVCTGTTKAGDPCQGRAGADGRCAAHKEANGEAGTDQAQEASGGEEGGEAGGG
jgi:hypothetical protein